MKSILLLAFQVTVALLDLLVAVSIGVVIGAVIAVMMIYMGQFGGTR